ncbi:MAG: hypothetical protein R6U20_07080, partial [Longimonas sp.]
MALTGCDTSVTPLEDSDPTPEQPASSDLSVALISDGMQHASSEDGPSYRCTANVLDPEAEDGYRTYDLALAFPDSVSADSSAEADSEFARLDLTLSLEPTADSTVADSTTRQMASRIRCNVPATEEALHLIADRIETDLDDQFGEEGYRFVDSDSTAQGNSQSSDPDGAAVTSKTVQDDGDYMDCNMSIAQPECDMDEVTVSADGGGDTIPIFAGPIDIPPPPDPSDPDGIDEPGGGSSPDGADCSGSLQGPRSASTSAHPASGDVPTWLIPQPDADPASGSDLLDPDYPDDPTPAEPPADCDDEETSEDEPEEEPSVEEQLETLLEEDPYALLDVPCDLIPEWQNVAGHEIPNAVFDRLNTEALFENAEIQRLEDASGAVINMDRYSVTVSANGLPDGMSAEQYLNQVRMNINDYAEGANFQYYPGTTNEADRWANNPIGTMFSIDLAPGANGSIVATDYSSSHWIFSTVYTDEDGTHPVSGNRQFGFTEND